MAALSITDAQLFEALRSFVMDVTGLDAKLVLRGPLNKSAMPKGDFIIMSPLSRAALATNVVTYADTTKSVMRSTQWGAQIDCYGTLSGDRAQIISTLLRDDYACEQFAASGLDIQPLYATDAKQMPLVTGEQQYVQRWTFEAVLQYNPVAIVLQDSAKELSIGLIESDERYKP